MIIDTSAVLAVLLDEPDAGRYENAIAAPWPRRMRGGHVVAKGEERSCEN